MSIESASLTVVTNHLPQTRLFYEAHFGAYSVFDCAWYVVLRFKSSSGQEICLIEPQSGMNVFAGGAFLNLQVKDVDQLHARLSAAGLSPVVPLEDHPWGDRGFGVLDPAGLIVYCYQSIAPAAEFQKYFIINP
ncbi:Glyoxalase/bleomycin resistance protein/dioxygenase [Desulfurispirillum indicum S5]|uniref:Glyoxalase/bleomycin resistance protein/dioxygenase n=1 Tax=Desulfurispirillum indicum (strain ATCC BAA-1389 / DSM 22839 / S5) TaxID=653733 RepID=E6W7C6_DESIS|nr:VOC family protein [Desulfurispirillum indicum]ADU66293.1 Glyoxalase/bleomycin resistance protein/dioxygenase [Desulfurispirillum indicum S5]